MTSPMLKVLLGLLVTPLAWGQCAPGIPSAGNPGCIPPNQTNSPYYQPPAQAAAQEKAVWEDRWGAIALDSETGFAGLAEHQVTEATAKRTALSQCSGDGGKACHIVLTYHNQCAAVAQGLSGGQIRASNAPTIEDAREIAINACGGASKCKVMYSSCTLAERVD